MKTLLLCIPLKVALVNLPPLPQSTTYIYRVSKELRKGNEHHYSPTTVFIPLTQAWTLQMVDNLNIWP